MNNIGKPEPLELNNEWKTGMKCPSTGTYICSMHPYVEKIVVEGDPFPKCDQKGIPHSTTWNKLF